MAAANSKVKVVSDEDVGHVCGFTLIKKDAISVTATKKAVPVFTEKEYEVLGTLDVASPANGLDMAPEVFEAVTLCRRKKGDKRVVLHHGGDSYEGLNSGKVARNPWSWTDATQELKDEDGDLVDHRNWKPAKAGSEGKAAKKGASTKKRTADDADELARRTKARLNSADATVTAAVQPGTEDGTQDLDALDTRQQVGVLDTRQQVGVRTPSRRSARRGAQPGAACAGAGARAGATKDAKEDALSVGDAVEWTSAAAHPAAGPLEGRSGRGSGKSPALVTTGTVTSLTEDGLVMVMWKRGSKQSSTMCGVQDITKAVDSA